jgi:hypothetical protein
MDSKTIPLVRISHTEETLQAPNELAWDSATVHPLPVHLHYYVSTSTYVRAVHVGVYTTSDYSNKVYNFFMMSTKLSLTKFIEKTYLHLLILYQYNMNIYLLSV